MARIRSIHPGLRTDEDYMGLSFPARDCLTGIWGEADDQGMFQWKPLTLKSRIFPADNLDMETLLQELVTHRWITRIEVEGVGYGLCRNFRKWQRPKKPSQVHPLPPEWRMYVGLKPVTVEPEPDEPDQVPHSGRTDAPLSEVEFPTGGELAPQREDGGGRKEDRPSDDGKPSPHVVAMPLTPSAVLFGQCREYLVRCGMTDEAARTLLGKWRKTVKDGDLIEIVSEAIAKEIQDPRAWVSAAIEQRFGKTKRQKFQV